MESIINKLSLQFPLGIYGKIKSGKTIVSLKLAAELSEDYKVLICVSEESKEYIIEKLKEFNADLSHISLIYAFFFNDELKLHSLEHAINNVIDLYPNTYVIYNRIILGQNQKLSLSTRNIISVGDSRETQYHFETHELLTSRVDSNISPLFELANMDNLSRYYFYYKRKEIK